MSKGTKRASPGATEEKENPLQGIELSDEDAQKLNNIQKDTQRIEIWVESETAKRQLPLWEKRRETLKSIPKFWPVALMNHVGFGIHVQHNSDQLALTYLEDVWLTRDPKEFRAFTLEFFFKENPHFTDKVLKKEYKYIPPPAVADDKPDENGITDTMLDFSWERDIEPSMMKINWKDPARALTKLYPREPGPEPDDDPVDPGSFFNFFELKSDPYEIGLTIANEVFPEAVNYFLDQGNEDDIDSDDSDDSDDDDDAEEIDLEKPRKKQKV
ncbi:hypothetical protein DFS33DRAFT_445049 [Desarmillaria ectypa]|nr:hypothetical protein DFS33DRAFT_445049 [Desarmillaria ectypa]